MSVSSLANTAVLTPDYVLSTAPAATFGVNTFSSSAQPRTLVWADTVIVPAGGASTLTFTYAAGAPHLFKAGDYVSVKPLALLATSVCSAVLTPAATATTDTLAITCEAVAQSIQVEVYRS
jgi:hypothetical protein